MIIHTRNGTILALRNGDKWDIYRNKKLIGECYTHLKAPTKWDLLNIMIQPLKSKSETIKDVYRSNYA